MAQLISVAQAVNDAAREIGISQTDVLRVLGSNDEDVVQMAALLTAVADELLLEEPYQDLLGDGNWLLDKDGHTYKARPTDDTDLLLFDSRLAISGLKYRFLQAKGLEFGEQMRDFLVRMGKIAVRANQRVLDLDAEPSRQI
jgi:hypothetical protein